MRPRVGRVNTCPLVPSHPSLTVDLSAKIGNPLEKAILIVWCYAVIAWGNGQTRLAS